MKPGVVGFALVALITAVPFPGMAFSPHQSAGPGTGTNPFDGARKAEERLSFVGSVEVTWEDARGSHSEHLDVRASGGTIAIGTIAIRGGSTVMAEPGGATMVRGPGGGWDLLWARAPTSAGRPVVDEKYDLKPVTQPVPTMVASRPTQLVEVSQAATVRERLFLDAETGLLLRREQLDLGGRPVHVVAFTSIEIGSQIPLPSTPTRLTDRSPHHLSSVSAPIGLPGGYRRVDAYREQGAIQVLYSDGLYDLSVFEQRGGLAPGDVPAAGNPVKIGSSEGWVYAWPGGQVVVWHRGHTVYSVVSEAPVDQLVAVAKALPAAGGSSLVTRLRRVCRNLVQPLAA